MSEEYPLTILCVSSYEKGQEFLCACKDQGCRVLLLTAEKLRNANWPRESIDEFFYMAEELRLEQLIHAVSYTARTQRIDRIVALDEFDVENVSALREHLRIPGMGLTTSRYFRDKLAMRMRAQEEGIPVPDFVHVLNYDALREYMARVAPPWLLKPRSQASGIGMKKIHAADELWPWLDRLGDKQSFYLLERFLPGDVFHVDSIVSERKVVFAAAHAYGKPPFHIAHEGGVFTSHTLPRSSEVTKQLLELNRKLIKVLGFVRGVTHAEFLKSHDHGNLYFIEIAARVGGAYIADMVEAASGINLWREWARIEVAGGKKPYEPPRPRIEYAGVILSLARQEHPDTSAYNDPEIVLRIPKHHHAGFVVKAKTADQVKELLESYAVRFKEDFMAVQPVPEKPSA